VISTGPTVAAVVAATTAAPAKKPAPKSYVDYGKCNRESQEGRHFGCLLHPPKLARLLVQ
jgi:hypothetical protein